MRIILAFTINQNTSHFTPLKHTASKTRLIRALNNFRLSLAYIEALPQLTLLGLGIGLITGLIIVLFRFLIEAPLSLMLPSGPESFEALTPASRTIMIFVGAAAIGLLLHIAGRQKSDVSVGHVLDRLHNYQGQLPFSNWIVQFVGAIICLISGQSVGREGPAAHLGAGAASQVGKWLRLPNNSLHTLIGCGVAAAISASFNIPMAGVIFAMEVIVLEYTVVGFVPVILASVMGTAVSQAMLGKVSFVVSNTDTNSLIELPFMLLIGFCLSLCAALYIRLNITALKFSHLPIVVRMLIAALITSGVAVYVPEIMGLGYDTVNLSITGQLALTSLILIAVAKLFVTPFVIGLGIPGGLIGPLLVIGACVGGAIGVVLNTVVPGLNASTGFYVILGMTGMMAATLNAPLASLVAVLELSYNPHMIFPAMLVIVVACVTTRQLFKLEGIFIEQLNHTGRTLDFGPAKQALRRVGVRSLMERNWVSSPSIVDYEEAKKLLTSNPVWIIIEKNEVRHALQAADLARYLEDAPVEVLSLEQPINLLDIPGRRLPLKPIHETASLDEALHALKTTQADALYVSRTGSPVTGVVQGIITTADIQNYYQPKEFRHVVE